ncbi:putative protein kinase RLK-Pelle-WAK family [Helianthus anomalus]
MKHLRRQNIYKYFLILLMDYNTSIYIDLEYINSGILNTKSDIYSFGVVLFEIMCWKLAYEETYSEKGLSLVAHQCYNEKTFNTLVYLKLMKVCETFLC